MTPEQSRRLNRLIWQDRLKRLLPVAVIGVVLLGAMLYVGSLRIAAIDATLETHLIHGEVLGAARLAGRNGGFQVHARLDNGSEVDAVSTLPQPPYQGEEVEIRAAQHASGRTTYNIVKLLN